MKANCISCIDGRACGHICGTAGGDAGVLLRVLLAIELEAQVHLSVATIKKCVMAAHKALGRPLYYHSDSHALHHYDPRTAGTVEGADKAGNIGCGYLKLAAVSPERLTDSAKEVAHLGPLAGRLVTVLSELLGTPEGASVVNYVILEGDHNEDAVTVDLVDEETLEANGHTFIYHPVAETKEAAVLLDACASLVGLAGALVELKRTCLLLRNEHWSKAIGILAPGCTHHDTQGKVISEEAEFAAGHC